MGTFGSLRFVLTVVLSFLVILMHTEKIDYKSRKRREYNLEWTPIIQEQGHYSDYYEYSQNHNSIQAQNGDTFENKANNDYELLYFDDGYYTNQLTPYGIKEKQDALFQSDTSFYLLVSVSLGIIGISGLIWQSQQTTNKQLQKDIDELRAQINSLSTSTSSVPQSVLDDITNLQTSVASQTTSISTLLYDLTTQTSIVTGLCSTVNEITSVSGATSDAYAQVLEAIDSPGSCS